MVDTKFSYSSGASPFPMGPGLNPREKVGKIVARAIKNRLEIVVDDWIRDDFSDGGLQFDNGLCGQALVSTWKLTRDERYLAAARKSHLLREINRFRSMRSATA